jgi:nucleotide-binding universal stress UspA family protein
MRILMAVDGSGHSVEALASACRILPAAVADVDLMCVAPGVRHGGPSRQQALKRRAERLLGAVAASLAELGIQTRQLVRTGSATRQLIGAAFNYDVLVMGAASRRDGWTGLGPVTGRVVEHSRQTVLVARKMSGTGLRILAPVDGSGASLSAIARLSALVNLSEAEVTLLHVVETPWLHEGADQEWAGYQEEEEEEIDPRVQWQKEFEAEAEAILEEARTRLPRGTSVNVIVARGLPAEEILSEAAQGGYDLIAVGTTNSEDLKHEILGSVSATVAWHAECSVLIIRGTV